MKARCLHGAQTLLQIMLLALIWWLADDLVRAWHLPLPANLTGMLLLLLAIGLGVIKLEWVRLGAGWLLAQMLLFFVPAVVAVVNYQTLLLTSGWRILLVLLLSTVLVFACTALVVDRLYRVELMWARRGRRHG